MRIHSRLVDLNQIHTTFILTDQSVMNAQDRKTQILDSAYKAFAREGYHGTTMDKIASRIGVTKGTLYLYFKDKADLFTSVLEDRILKLESAISESLKNCKDPEEKLLAVLKEFGRYGRRERHFFSMLYRSAPLPSKVRKLIGDRVSPIKDRIELEVSSIMEEGIRAGKFKPLQPRSLAIAFLGMTQGFLRNPPRVTALVQMISEIFFYGVKVDQRKGVSS